MGVLGNVPFGGLWPHLTWRPFKSIMRTEWLIVAYPPFSDWWRGVDLCFCQLVMGHLWTCLGQSVPYDYYLLSLFEEDLLESLPFLVFPSVDVMLFSTVVFILHRLFASSVLVRLLLLLHPEAQSKTKPASLSEDIPLHRDEQSAPLCSLKRLPPAGVFLVDEARVFITERCALQTVSPPEWPPPSRTSCLARNLCFHRGGK